MTDPATTPMTAAPSAPVRVWTDVRDEEAVLGALVEALDCPARIVEIGRYWSHQPTGESGRWVLAEIDEASAPLARRHLRENAIERTLHTDETLSVEARRMLREELHALRTHPRTEPDYWDLVGEAAGDLPPEDA